MTVTLRVLSAWLAVLLSSWHDDADLKNVDAVIIPGGFSTVTTCVPALLPRRLP